MKADVYTTSASNMAANSGLNARPPLALKRDATGKSRPSGMPSQTLAAAQPTTSTPMPAGRVWRRGFRPQKTSNAMLDSTSHQEYSQRGDTAKLDTESEW